EVRAGRNGERGKLVAPPVLLGDRWIVGPHAVVGVERVGLVERPPVDEDEAIADRDGLSGQPDDALQESPARILRKAEDADVAAAGPSRREERGERPADRRVEELVHEHPVAGQDGLLHRRARNLEGLKKERAREQRENDGGENRIRPLAERPRRGIYR